MGRPGKENVPFFWGQRVFFIIFFYFYKQLFFFLRLASPTQISSEQLSSVLACGSRALLPVVVNQICHLQDPSLLNTKVLVKF